jgi:ATP synthase protein I
MTDRNGDESGKEMAKAVWLRRKRDDLWQRSGDRTLRRNLSMVGALGWLIVAPTLFGILLGRWLDTHLGTGVFWSGALIVLGTALGGYLAWQRISKE